jgi:hypothetical protein
LRVLIAATIVVCMGGKLAIARAYQQTNLVSDIQRFAQNPNGQPDTQFLNPWGLIASPTSPWWVSDNNAGVATLYNGQGVKQGLVVDIPSPVSGVAGTPTGVVFTGATGFSFQTDGKTAAAAFTFVTEDRTLVARAPGIDPTDLANDAFGVVDNSNNPTAATGAVYKGATIAQMTKDGPFYFSVTNIRSGRQRGVVDFSYEFPFGTGKRYLKSGVLGKALEQIGISGIMSTQTGHPYSVFTQLDNGRTGVASFSWPDVLSDPNQNPGPRIQNAGVKTGVNLNAFSSTFLGHIGESGRNQFYGPHDTNADAVLIKNLQITDRFRMQFRSESFNVFNHPHFRQPGNVIENPGTFGLSTQTLTRPDLTTSARQTQLALKLNF